MGLKGFVDSIRQQYHDVADQVAEAAAAEILNEISTDELRNYADAAVSGSDEEIRSIRENEKYRRIRENLGRLRSSFRLTDIYVVTYTAEELRSYKEGDSSWKPLVYIFDTFVETDKIYELGQRSSMNHKNIELFAEVTETLRSQDKHIISSGDFGYNMSTLKPVLASDGRIAAIIGVEVPMIRIQAVARDYLIRTIAITMLLMLIIIILFIYYLSKRVIKPVDVISEEVCRFGRNNDITEESAAKLGSIQTGNGLQSLAEYIGKMEKDIIDNVENIKKITAEKERISAELNVATQIQADMLPCIFPAFPERKEFDVYASMTPAKEVGGDFYDFFLLDDDHLALVMADVSGKGVPAALFMVISKTLIKDQAQMCNSPKTILEEVNNKLYDSNAEGMFVTVWLGIYEISTGRIVAANAGHEYPAIRKADGQFELLKDKHGMMVGAMQGIKYKEYEMEIEKGGCLFLYTDGVPEATDSGNELFGTDRMINALNIEPMADPVKLLKNVKESVDEFVGTAPQFDDLTMLAIVRN